jgi:hypothetical protein
VNICRRKTISTSLLKVGPDEFEVKGLSPDADELIANLKSYFTNILIVIRKSLLANFSDYYEFKPKETKFIRFDWFLNVSLNYYYLQFGQ